MQNESEVRLRRQRKSGPCYCPTAKLARDPSHPDPKADGFTDQFQYRTESIPRPSNVPSTRSNGAKDPKFRTKRSMRASRRLIRRPRIGRHSRKGAARSQPDGFYEWKKVVGGRIPRGFCVSRCVMDAAGLNLSLFPFSSMTPRNCVHPVQS
jgi:hypothetical protein